MTRPTRREALAVAAGLAAPRPAPAGGGHPTSLVRLSVLGDEAFAPTEAGNLVRGDYDPAKRVGRLGRLAAPALAAAGSAFRGYVEHSARDRAPRLGGGPVAVLVHGFLADPREDVRPDAPQRTNNPHDFSYTRPARGRTGCTRPAGPAGWGSPNMTAGRPGWRWRSAGTAPRTCSPGGWPRRWRRPASASRGRTCPP